jgi:hypothetical protein
MRIPLESSMVFSVLLVCCQPTEISEARFQSRAQTCYPLPVLDDGGIPERSDAGRLIELIPDNCEPAVSTGSTATGGTSTGGIMTPSGGGLISVGGNGSTGSNGATPGPSLDGGVVARDGGTGPGTGGQTSPPAMNQPVCDATLIFRKPIEMGGCSDTNGAGGCHEGGATGTIPDLFSPGVAARLLNGSSKLVVTADTKGTDCAYKAASDRIWIKAGYDETSSFLWNKITSDEASILCGKPMPDMEPSLGDDSKECIRDWIRAVASGGG